MGPDRVWIEGGLPEISKVTKTVQQPRRQEHRRPEVIFEGDPEQAAESSESEYLWFEEHFDTI